MIPLVGLFEGDFVALFVAVEEEDTVTKLAEKIAEHAVGLRVKQEPDRSFEVVYDGEVLPNVKKVKEIGISPMDIVLVRYA
jgi:toluene monooxygenase system protein B